MVKKTLDGAVACSLSTDSWTSNSQMGYMGIKCHLIDKDLNLKDFNLNFKYLEHDHEASYIYSILSSVIDEWSIKQKVYI